MKKCSKCKVIQPLTNFCKCNAAKDKLNYQCKGCRKVDYVTNIESTAAANKIWYIENKAIIREKAAIYYTNNKEKKSESLKRLIDINPNYIKEKQKKNYLKNRDKILANCRNRYKTDPVFKLMSALRRKSYKSFKAKKFQRNSTNIELLGVELAIAKQHIERQFKKGMSWENHGQWHIDHIIPISYARTEDEIKKLFHYTNLQPLWAIDNLKKSSKILPTQMKIAL